MTDREKFLDYRNAPTIEKRNKLVEENLHMVDILIKKYLGKGVDYDDLYQVGSLALVSAVERYDPGKGFEFSTFATPTILGEIKKYFRDKQWSLKVPRRLKEIAAKVQDTKENLAKKLLRQPTVKEIAEASGIEEEQIIEALDSAKAYSAYSLDKSFDEAGEDGDAVFEKYTAFEDVGYNRIELMEIINKVVGEMKPQDRKIFTERFLNDRSQADIAKELGVSQMTVSRAEKNMVSKFRSELMR
ncbi:MAG: SigB/SigF/SigG family RNA polymerase sigma factor [Firmicutes bacterium]|nr:SigB/SigF/SigG family RNA polymerase sigma factor [Bacillota bacterium]